MTQDWIESLKEDLAMYERARRAKRSRAFQDTMAELGISVPDGYLRWSDGQYLFIADFDDKHPHLLGLQRADALQVVGEAWNAPSLSEDIAAEIIERNFSNDGWGSAVDAFRLYYFPKGASGIPLRVDIARAITRIENALEFLAKQRWAYEQLYPCNTTKESA